MEDYVGNSNKQKEEANRPQLRIVDKVVDGKVLPPKKNLGRKFRETFIQTDMKTVSGYLITDVLIPSVRNLLWDALTRGVSKMIYGNSMRGGGQLGPGGSIFNYSGISQNNNPLSRPSPLTPGGPPRALNAGPIQQQQGYAQNQYFLVHKEEAQLVLERMNDLIDSDYRFASVADLHQLMNLEHNYVDEGWGWYSLAGAQIHPTRDGWILALPQAQVFRR